MTQTAQYTENARLPRKVKVVEVGPRDGLQNEKQSIDTDTKIQLIHQLEAAGVSYIEAGSFVNPKWVPQMAGSEDVFKGIIRHENTTYAALTPNMQGFDRALASGATEVAIFAAASESFSQKNINCSIQESINRFKPIMAAAEQHRIKVRGYISCVVGCPYEGAIQAAAVSQIAEQLRDMGCYEISLGDTTGVATPADITHLITTLTQRVAIEQLAIHCHDTYGQALANIYAALQLGIAVVDSSIAGLGGCPYAKGASGNVASEDLLYMLNGLGIETGIDIDRLIAAGNFISQQLGRPNASRVARAKHA